MKRHSRYNVVGTSGSGKSTFSRALAEAVRAPYVEMDLLFWLPDWTMPEDEAFFPKLEAALAGDSWVVDGNYTRTTPIKWARVECVVWLDFSFAVTMSRAIRRNTSRIWSGKELWPGTGNRESFRTSYLSRDSILLWTLTHYRPNRRKFQAAMNDARYRHIEFCRLRSPAEADRYIEAMREAAG